jgi:toxin ParE1/3/4
MAGSKPYRLHRLAWLEIEGGDDWYRERNADASVAFISAIADALESIAETPRRWPEYLHGTRRFILQRFPFSVIYFDEPDVVNIVAVAHHKRRPGYWRRRITH